MCPLCSHFQQPCTLNKLQYPASRDVFKVTWFHKVLTWVPISYCSQSVTVTKNVLGHFRGLFASVTLGTVYQPNFKYMFFWQCPFNNCTIVYSWLLLQLSNSSALLVEGLRKVLAYFCLWTDCQYSLSFLVVPPLITLLAIFPGMRNVGWGPVSGCEKPCSTNLPICPHVSWHPYQLNPVMFGRFYQGYSITKI